MSDMVKAILDSAERRIRAGGFDGFSYRDIAADVGIKASSVHYHFPSKESLAASVIRRYTATVADMADEALKQDGRVVRVWTRLFRGTAFSVDHMCPATVLGAGAMGLPAEVAAEVTIFFQMCLDKMVAQGLAPAEADKVLSTLIGALVTSNAVGDPAAYDRATSALVAA